MFSKSATRVKEVAIKLDITSQEVLEMWECDKRIEKGEDLFPLSTEQEKNSKQARQVARAPAKQKVIREKKVNQDKLDLIIFLQDALRQQYQAEVKTINPEREFLFTLDEKIYKIVLSMPRRKGD